MRWPFFLRQDLAIIHGWLWICDSLASASWVLLGLQACITMNGWDAFLFFVGWVWTQGFVLAKQCSNAWTTPLVHFALVILEMGSQELFAWSVLEPWSSWSRPSKWLGLQSWATGAQLRCFSWLIYRGFQTIEWPLKQWAKINLPIFKLFLSGICHSNKKVWLI
jgi:hypothetical protein